MKLGPQALLMVSAVLAVTAQGATLRPPPPVTMVSHRPDTTSELHYLRDVYVGQSFTVPADSSAFFVTTINIYDGVFDPSHTSAGMRLLDHPAPNVDYLFPSSSPNLLGTSLFTRGTSYSFAHLDILLQPGQTYYFNFPHRADTAYQYTSTAATPPGTYYDGGIAFVQGLTDSDPFLNSPWGDYAFSVRGYPVPEPSGSLMLLVAAGLLANNRKR
jgi:hypothetical protein